MSTHYKHTKKETADVPFTFRCEQCMQESGLKFATSRVLFLFRR
ncbi:hypothetical protein C809_01532 [Lachnospiraceae bacterium MD335]|nr:hypothetical protein C809_01532 [Lachnospiraceae bacterium MD335]